MTPRIDPIAFEVFKNALFSIADEMALTILRTAYSGVLKDVMDYSTAFCDGQGRTVAQGLTLPAHLCSFPDALAATLRRHGDRMRPGDVYCLNDPFEGGMHLPDIFVLKPIFYRGERLGFAATVCHHTDVGGRVAGSNAADSTEIYAEGLRLPPVPRSSRRTSGCPSASSATSAPSLPPVTSRSRRSWAWSSATGSRPSGRTCRS
jgi:N-methylhydantoinase B